MNEQQVINNTYKQRKSILEIHNNKCDNCDFQYNLEVHHPHYDYLDIKELKVLCKICHENLHKTLPKLSRRNIINFEIPEELHREFKKACIDKGVDMKDRLLVLIEKDVKKAYPNWMRIK